LGMILPPSRCMATMAVCYQHANLFYLNLNAVYRYWIRNTKFDPDPVLTQNEILLCSNTDNLQYRMQKNRRVLF
jgi:hypothetical protein